MRANRIVAWAVVGAVILVSVLAWSLRPLATTGASDEKEAWIGLPTSGMDARDPEVRKLLRLSGPLAQSCGMSDDSLEIYVASIGDPVFAPKARQWRAELNVHATTIDVKTWEVDVLPPPPPKLVQGQSFEVTRLPAKASYERSQLEAIRRAWRKQSLWDAPQGTVSCTDGQPIRLEACVRGQYAARDLRCTAEPSEIDALWREIQKLPVPPKTIYTIVPADQG